ncbi:MAG: P-loop NTPase [Bdellovibrionales bacterium]|nr:P-loop NTPase [Bdellovibrionales bacterium]
MSGRLPQFGSQGELEAFPLVAPVPESRRVVWAIGGGKGGIGKSFISSSLAIYLAQTGKNVVIVDFDLGGANLHTCLGTEIPSKSLSDFLAGRTRNINDIVSETGIKNLRFISGANDALNVANVDGHKVESLLEAIKTIPCDYLILDLGAGTSQATLDFFLAADRSIVAITPEPTSIENAYRFIKSAMYRKIRLVEQSIGIQRVVEEAMDHRNKFGIRSPSDLIRHVAQMDKNAGQRFLNEIKTLKMNLIINQVRTRSDVELGTSIKSVCQRYFGIDTDFVGHLEFDNAVWQSVRRKRPTVLEYPHSLLVSQVSAITKNLIDPNRGSQV